MTDLKDDKDLERRFELLRSRDRVSLRSLEALLASKTWRTPKRPRSLRLATALLVILLAVVLTVVVQARLALERRAAWPVRVGPDSVHWSGPTEFLLATGGLLAQTSGEKTLEENLFPPELLLRNGQRLDLKPEQRTVIAQEFQQLQNKVAELQSRMPDEGTRLVEILQRDRVGENEALTQLDRVLAVEREMKKAELAMLIRIKNVLTPAQQSMLKRLR
jgi:hypothetical protein